MVVVAAMDNRKFGSCRPAGWAFSLIAVTEHTGAGWRAGDLLPLVRGATSTAELRRLPDPALWGGPIEDERYLIVATA
jgi:hypothetical protein